MRRVGHPQDSGLPRAAGQTSLRVDRAKTDGQGHQDALPPETCSLSQFNGCIQAGIRAARPLDVVCHVYPLQGHQVQLHSHHGGLRSPRRHIRSPPWGQRPRSGRELGQRASQGRPGSRLSGAFHPRGSQGPGGLWALPQLTHCTRCTGLHSHGPMALTALSPGDTEAPTPVGRLPSPPPQHLPPPSCFHNPPSRLGHSRPADQPAGLEEDLVYLTSCCIFSGLLAPHKPPRRCG